MKIYTRSGDKGMTSLFDGSRIDKSDIRIDLLGELDELNARIGYLTASSEIKKFIELEFLARIQSLLLDLGSEIANPGIDESKFKDFSEYVLQMEKDMDQMDLVLDELKNFILPGGNISASLAHLCRTQARKCERIFVSLNHKNNTAGQFLNRLSDYFFVLARFINRKNGVEDSVWRQ